eukprot:PhM_4_TR1206/c0_g1_i1/m.20727/K06171/NCSTN; nicastrin
MSFPKALIILCHSLLFFIIFVGAQTTDIPAPGSALRPLYDRFFTAIASPKPCVTLNHLTGTIGCTTRGGVEDATLFLVESDSDLQEALAYRGGDITVVIDLCYPRCGSSQSEVLRKLNNTEHIRGVVVSKTDKGVILAQSDAEKSVFNPNGSGLNWQPLTFSLLQMVGDDINRVFAMAKRNKNKKYAYPLFMLQQNYDMASAGMTAKECLSSKKCLPVGGFSPWASTHPLSGATPSTEYIALITSTSSTTLFHDDVPAALSNVAPMAALAAVAEAIAAMPDMKDAAKTRPILFLFADAEPFGRAGSRRFLKDLDNFTCDVTAASKNVVDWTCLQPYYRTTNFTNLHGNRIRYAIEVGQVGSLTRTPKFHVDSAHNASSTSAESLTRALQDAGCDAAKTHKGVLPATSSLHSFFEAAPSVINQTWLGAALFTDYDGTFSDDYFETVYDKPERIDPVAVQDKANILLEAVVRLSLLPGTLMPSSIPTINGSTIASWISCFDTDAACDKADRYVGAAPAAAKSVVPSRYPGVFWFESDKTRSDLFLQRFLADMFKISARRPTTGCELYESPIMEGTTIGECVLADAYLQQAFSAAIEYNYQKYYFEVVQTTTTTMAAMMDGWTESYWPLEIGARVYLGDSAHREGMSLLSGLLFTSVTMLYFWSGLHERLIASVKK